MDIAELSRMLANVIRTGTVIDVDHGAARCRVKSGKIDTNWLPWVAHRAGNTLTWTPPTEGEQVIIFSPSGEMANGIVLTGLYSDSKAAPSSSPSDHIAVFPDGAKFRYDHEAGLLSFTGVKNVVFEASESVTFDTPLTHAKGKTTSDDLLTYSNGINGTGGENNNIISGDFNHGGGKLTSNGVVVHEHDHGGVQRGSANTDGPNPGGA